MTKAELEALNTNLMVKISMCEKEIDDLRSANKALQASQKDALTKRDMAKGQIDGYKVTVRYLNDVLSGITAAITGERY